MSLQLYMEDLSGRPLPLLKLNPEDLSIECVDTKGCILCTLFENLGNNNLEPCHQAQDQLEESGFSTDWAAWGYNGEFLEYRK